MLYFLSSWIFARQFKYIHCINHEILLSKLNTYDIRRITLDWFSSYLTNREQYICINNENSNPKIIQCGVLQGSILGPLLFIFFINYITKCANQFKYILYADDSTLSTCIPGAGYSKACLISGTFFSTSLIWIRIQRKPYGEDFPHTQINIFSPLCFPNEIRTVAKLTNHKQRNK